MVMRDTSLVLDPSKMNLARRNDVWIYNYNSAPGVDGDDLYVVPGYQGPSHCDNSIGECNSEITSNYPQVEKGHLYPLRDGDIPEGPLPLPTPVLDVESITVSEDCLLPSNRAVHRKALANWMNCETVRHHKCQ